MQGEPVTLCLTGDVMLGRGIDQILPHPGDPALAEAYLRDARSYVELAEAANGPIPQPVDFSWPCGDALDVLERAAPDARVLNLETSITRHGDPVPGKGVHYRMHPANLPCLAAARPDVCVLANNHVLDYGRPGLEETLEVLAGAGFRTAGAGRDADAAGRPAVVPLDGGGRILVFSFGMPSSGIPPDWAATADRSGIDFVTEPSAATAAPVVARIRQVKEPGDVVIASIHWGSNWGYLVPREHIRFAHALVEGGVDVVHGHSSHHPRPLEVYRGRLITYGCGDLIDDYEGISGYELYRDDLRLLYFPSLEPGTGELLGLRLVPLQAHRMRLRRAAPEDCQWLCETLDRISHGFGSPVRAEPDGSLTLAVRDHT
ncbi:CapA family protein [Streptomyces sp. NPDC002054]|uniref:CapA family protein n=1 Tax=Streptomyces sp. NPDC002054 TaxID=3154663 RepID=UPI00331BD091